MEEKKTKKSTAKKNTTKKASTTKTTKKPSTVKAVTKIEPKKEIVTPKTETKGESKNASVLSQSKSVKKNAYVEETRKRIIYFAIAIVIILIALLFILVKRVPKLKDGKSVVASIDGKEFTAEDLYGKMKPQYGTSILVNMIDNFIADKEVETTNEAKEYADNQLASLKDQYATYGRDFAADLKNAGYKNEQALLDEIILEYKKDKAVQKYIQGTITDEEVEEYYNTNIFGAITAKHILITPEVTDTMTTEEKAAAETKALNEAKDIITKLNNGENFDELAKTYSDDTGSKDNGGLISNFTKTGSTAVVEEFWNAAYNLENNKYTTSPVQSKYGYHIILKISAQDRPTLDSVKTTIKETMTTDKLTADQNLSVTAWAELRKKYNLTIIDDEIKSTYESTISSYK